MGSSVLRVRYLDGLRGVAISMVMLWHFFGPASADILPYGARYASVPILSSGWMGVELFFLISGFVIFMTLEKSAGIADFLVRRWLRLFPAMLIATALLMAADKLMGMPGPHGSANPIDIVPGLTFVDPAFWHAIVGVPVKSLSGVFWTLYVEVAFYLVFSVLYFRLGWRLAIAGLVLVEVALSILDAASDPRVGLGRLIVPMLWCGVQYFGWFASGALFYKAKRENSRALLALAIAVGFLSVALFRSTFGLTVAEYLQLASVVILFAAAQIFEVLQKLLSRPTLLFMGLISYPLYLVHSNLGIPLIAKAAQLVAPAPPELGAGLTIAALVVVAWLIQKFAEPWTKARLQPLADHARTFMRLAAA